VYLINLDLGTKQLIKYQSNRFIMSFFVDNVFVLVEDHGCKLFDLGSGREQSIRLAEEHMIIRGVQLANHNVYIILLDVSGNKLKLCCFEKENFISNHCKVFNLADLIPDSQLNPNLRYKEIAKLVAIPDFKFNHTIDSWLPLHNSNWNTLIGQVTHWDVPYKEADYFLRKERFDFIEITIK
jgi:hypothetical protein